ncbi:MAG: phage portal protein [Pirellulales bacterium]|nr:phage portal protein [Pirellulales bacterium]
MRTTLDRWEHRLQEAFDELYASFVDPSEPFHGEDGERWLPLGMTNAVLATELAFRNEQELAEIRHECRLLATTNEFAINGHENRVSYIVGTGHTYRATPKKGLAVPERLAAQAQEVLDEFVRENAWHCRQQEIVRRRDRDGEAFLRFFADDDGTTRVRFVEPGQVSTPHELLSDESVSFGIETAPHDVEQVRCYYVEGERVPAEEMQHRKANVDANVKRGLPLFFPVRKNLRRAERILRNMSVVAEIQSAIALIRKHRGGSRTAVEQFVRGQADATVSRGASGRTASYRRYGAGTILDAYGDVEYDFPAAGIEAGNFVMILQAELRAIASRLVMPEFMLTSDASNANYSSTMVAEGPAVKMFERLQAEQVEADLDVMRLVVSTAARAGRLPEEVLELVEIQVGTPSLSVRNQVEEARIRAIEHQHGILSPQTWSQQRGLDYDQEQANLALHAARGAIPHGNTHQARVTP